LGRALSGATWTNGKPWVAELLFYSKLLTEDQRIAIGRYLNQKYQLTTNSPAASTVTCQAPDPRTIIITWNPVANGASYTLVRQTDIQAVTLLTTDSRTTNFTDTFVSAAPITYQVTVKNYYGQVQTSLLTPLMDITTPRNEATYYVSNNITVELAPHGDGPVGPGMTTFSPTKLEIYRNGSLYLTQINGPWGFTDESSVPTRWNITARAFDSAGNNRYTPTLGVNVTNDIDSDGDGVPDGLDAFPFDPTTWNQPAPAQTDTTAPIITIVEP
jgi:hypothetical protein